MKKKNKTIPNRCLEIHKLIALNPTTAYSNDPYISVQAILKLQLDDNYDSVEVTVKIGGLNDQKDDQILQKCLFSKQTKFENTVSFFFKKSVGSLTLVCAVLYYFFILKL